MTGFVISQGGLLSSRCEEWMAWEQSFHLLSTVLWQFFKQDDKFFSFDVERDSDLVFVIVTTCDWLVDPDYRIAREADVSIPR